MPSDANPIKVSATFNLHAGEEIHFIVDEDGRFLKMRLIKTVNGNAPQVSIHSMERRISREVITHCRINAVQHELDHSQKILRDYNEDPPHA